MVTKWVNKWLFVILIALDNNVKGGNENTMDIVINDSRIGKSDRLQWVKLFEEAGINYCILRDIKSCIGGNPPLEIDILIYNHDLPEVREILFKAGYLMRSNRVQYPHFHFYLYKAKGLVSILDIVIDLRVGKSGKIIKTLQTHSLLSHSKVVSGLKVVSEDDELVLLLLHSLIDKGVMLEKHRLRLRELLLNPDIKNDAQKKLSFLIGDTIIANRLLEDLSKEDIDGFLGMKNKIIMKLFVNASFPEKKDMIINKFYMDCYKYLHTLFKRESKIKLFSVVGIDGAGKTTFIEKFHSDFSKDYNIVLCRLGYGALRSYYFELTYFLCPIDQNVRIEREKRNKEIKEPMSLLWIEINRIIIYFFNIKPFRRFLKRYVIDLLLYLEDVIAINKSKKQAAKNGIIITDRSAIDRIIYSISRKGKIPWRYRFLYIMIYPYPDLTVFLDCGAETAVRRKGEMTIDQAMKMNESYIHFFSHLYGYPSIRLDSNSPLNEIENIVNFALRKL